MTKILSFKGKQNIKDKYIARLQAHYNADEIIKGVYWEKGKGCAVGCTVHSNSHDAYQTELGISWRLALIEDSIFEKLPNDQAKEFPLQFLNAIPVGVDTEIAFQKFIIWSLSDEKFGLIGLVKNKEVKEILTDILNLYNEHFITPVEQSRWSELTKRANYAYAYAASASYASAYASYASASASASASYASAYASAYAYASASASAASSYASAYASASAASSYASAYASASAASASASAKWEEKYNEVILAMRDKLIEFLSELK